MNAWAAKNWRTYLVARPTSTAKDLGVTGQEDTTVIT
jgi:hypothetical protein